MEDDFKKIMYPKTIKVKIMVVAPVWFGLIDFYPR